MPRRCIPPHPEQILDEDILQALSSTVQLLEYDKVPPSQTHVISGSLPASSPTEQSMRSIMAGEYEHKEEPHSMLSMEDKEVMELQAWLCFNKRRLNATEVRFMRHDGPLYP